MYKTINIIKDIFFTISHFLLFQFVYIVCLPFVVMFLSVFLIYFISIFFNFYNSKDLIDFLFMSGFLFNFIKVNLILFFIVSIFIVVFKRVRTFVKNCSQIFNSYILYYDEDNEIRINKSLFYLLLFR